MKCQYCKEETKEYRELWKMYICDECIDRWTNKDFPKSDIDEKVHSWNNK